MLEFLHVEQLKTKFVNTIQGDEMKREYDFSGGVRGKFFRAGVRLNLPIYLDKDISDFIEKFASRKKIDRQTVVNTLLRSNKEILQTLQ